MKKTIKIVTGLIVAVLVILLAFVLLKGCGSSKVDKSGFYSKDIKTSKTSSSSSKSRQRALPRNQVARQVLHKQTLAPRLQVMKLVLLLVQQLLHQHKRKLKHQRNQVKGTVLIKLEPQLLNLIRKQVMVVGKPLLVLWSC